MKRKCCCRQSPCCCGRGNGGGEGNGGGQPPPGWEPQPVGTWLLIRYDTSDAGARPVPSGDVWWTSPDIWIEGGDQYGNPISGQQCIVHARVWNLGGLDAMPVIVTFSFIEPGLGLTGLKPIGTVGAFVPSANCADVPIPWTPPPVVGDVHSCIVVTCSCPVTSDIASVPGNVVADRHTGQRNMTIIGTPMKMMEFQLTMTNLRPWAATVQLGARALWTNAPRALLVLGVTDVPSIRTAVRAINQPNTLVGYRLLAGRAAMVTHHPGEFTLLPEREVPELVRVKSVHPGHMHNAGAVVPPPNRINATNTSVIRIGRPAELKSLQSAIVHFEVKVPPPEKNHEWLVVHIAQITEGLIEGGYTVAMRTASKQAAVSLSKTQAAAHGKKE
jgi:hypothetical protein